MEIGEDPASPETVPPGAWAVRATALLLLAALAAAVTLLGSSGTLFLDDLSLYVLARSHAAPGPGYLLTPWFGHLFPAGMLWMWLQSRLFGLTKIWYGLVQGGGIFLAGLLVYRLLRTILGERARTLIPLAFFCLSGAVLSAAGWWANAMWLTPLLAITALATTQMLNATAQTHERAVWWCLGLLITGLAVTEKAVLLPFGLFAVAWSLTPGRWLPAALTVWRTWRRLWTLAIGVLALYAILYMGVSKALLGTKPFLSNPGMAPEIAGNVWRRGFPAGLFGGPVNWFNAILATPPQWFLVYSGSALALTCLACLVSNRAGRRLLLWASVYLTGTAVLIAAGRLLGDTGILVIMQVRYYADAVLWFAIALALALRRDQGSSREPRAVRKVLSLGAAMLVAISAVCWVRTVTTAQQAFSAEANSGDQVQIRATLAAIRALPPDVQILDRPLRTAPFGVVETNTKTAVTMSDFFGPLVGGQRFVSSSPNPVIQTAPQQFAAVRAHGHLVHPDAAVCLTPDRPSATITLPAPLFPNSHLVRVNSSQDGPGRVLVRLDGEPGGTLLLIEGVPETTTWVDGGGADVHLQLAGGPGSCVHEIEVGPPEILRTVG